MEKVRLHDIDKACVKVVRLLKRNNFSIDQVFRIVTKVSGTLKGYRGMNSPKLSIKDELIEFRAFNLGDYIQVYLKASENVLNFLYPKDARIQSSNLNDLQFIEDGLVLTASHDSCWNEGFKFAEFFNDEDVIIEILKTEVCSYEPISTNFNPNIEHNFAISSFALNLSSKFNFWFKFMSELHKNKLTNCFDVEFISSEGEFSSVQFWAFFDNKGKGTIVVTSIDEDNKKASINIDSFTEESIAKYFPNHKFNYMSEWEFELLPFVGEKVIYLIGQGIKVEVENKSL